MSNVKPAKPSARMSFLHSLQALLAEYFKYAERTHFACGKTAHSCATENQGNGYAGSHPKIMKQTQIPTINIWDKRLWDIKKLLF